MESKRHYCYCTCSCTLSDLSVRDVRSRVRTLVVSSGERGGEMGERGGGEREREGGERGGGESSTGWAEQLEQHVWHHTSSALCRFLCNGFASQLLLEALHFLL